MNKNGQIDGSPNVFMLVVMIIIAGIIVFKISVSPLESGVKIGSTFWRNIGIFVGLWFSSGTALFFYGLKNVEMKNLNLTTLKEMKAKIGWNMFFGLWLSFIFNWPLFLIAGHLTEEEADG